MMPGERQAPVASRIYGIPIPHQRDPAVGSDLTTEAPPGRPGAPPQGRQGCPEGVRMRGGATAVLRVSVRGWPGWLDGVMTRDCGYRAVRHPCSGQAVRCPAWTDRSASTVTSPAVFLSRYRRGILSGLCNPGGRVPIRAPIASAHTACLPTAPRQTRWCRSGPPWRASASLR